MIKLVFEKLCCSAVASFFGKYTAPRHTVPDNNIVLVQNTVKGSQIFDSANFIQQMDFRTVIAERMKNVRSGQQVFTDFAANTAKWALIPQRGAIAQTDVVGLNTADAQRTLESAGVVVDKVESYDSGRSGRNLVDFTAAPFRLEQGTRVKRPVANLLFHDRHFTQIWLDPELRVEGSPAPTLGIAATARPFARTVKSA